MGTPMSNSGSPVFYTVKEAAEILRVNAATIYAAIREDAFPAVRLRSRYVVPAAALERLATEAAGSGGVVDVSIMMATRRAERDAARLAGGGWS